MKKTKSFWLALILVGAAWKSAHGAPNLDIHCGIVKDSFHYGYCTHRVPGSTSQDVLYYLHSGGGSEYEWQHSNQIEKLYEAWGTKAPIVITVSYGSQWLLAERNPSKYSGLFEHFTNRVIPYLEQKIDFIPIRRLLVGTSMGGFNASQLYLKSPNLFSKVALLCPALSTLSPYDSSDKIDAYLRRTRAFDQPLWKALNLSTRYYPDQKSWEQAAPISLAIKNVNQYYPKIFVSVGSQDQYGFFEGSKEFADAVKSKGGSIQWSLVSGNHCSFDQAGGIEFIASP